ncbi:MAG: LUD domain-containing protein [Phycisphaerales bacterium]|nr:LUD domain-containing protein [Phycisphaerales bacterium]
MAQPSNEPSLSVIDRVRRALGRTEPIGAPINPPPVIDEPITRLVQSDIGLGELFARRAEENKMIVHRVYPEELSPTLVRLLMDRNCRRLALPDSPLLRKLNVIDNLRGAGLDASTWDQMSLDEVYDCDAGVTDVFAAVAETGSLVIRPTPQHGRALSLVPLVHVAIVQPLDLVADLVDLFDNATREGNRHGLTIISGPSKTSDIEMNLVTGVHGPCAVGVLLLQ